MSTYKGINPRDEKPVYYENDRVEHLLAFAGEMLLPGTVRLTGRVAVLRSGVKIPTGSQIYLDRDAGAHSFLENYSQTFTTNGGLNETINNYARKVKMNNQAGEYEINQSAHLANGMELRTVSDTVSSALLEGVENSGPDGLAMDFTIYLETGINNIVDANGNPSPLSNARSGNVLISYNLAPINHALYGPDLALATDTLQFFDLRLFYQTVPDTAGTDPVFMIKTAENQITLNSTEVNYSTVIAGLCDSVHASFIQTAHLANSSYNYLGCEPVPGQPSYSNEISYYYGFEKLTFSINDTDTALSGFDIVSAEEILWNYLRSFNSQPTKNSTILKRIYNPYYPDAYGIGINFGAPIDLSQTQFQVVMQSQISNTAPYQGYFYFRQMIPL